MKLNIYHYTSALTYLTDSYKNLKLTTESSLRDWSKSMGFTSPNLVFDLLKKKRPLKLKYADNLAIALNLNSNEKVYFKSMILMEKAVAEEEIAFYKELLTSLRPQDTFVDSQGGIFSHWLNVVIFTLAQMSKRPMTVKEIQSYLKQEVALKTIEDSLKILVDNHLMEMMEDRSYKLVHLDSITTQNDIPTKAVHNYYYQVIQKAQSAIKMDVAEREFQCFAIGIKKESLLKIKEIIRGARKEIANFSDEQGDLVYQFNFNGFPMAEISQENTSLN